MNELLNSILYLFIFIFPGLIITMIINRVIPKKEKDYNLELLNFIVYSTINSLVWVIPIYKFLSNNQNIEEHYILIFITFILYMFLTPLCIALIIIYFNKINLLEKLFEKLKIRFIESDPSAWDFKFSNMESEWVIVTFKDNKTVAGFMGSTSCASSIYSERDIYINEVYIIKENNKWERVHNTAGIYIKQDEIKCIEFFKDRKEILNEKSAK